MEYEPVPKRRRTASPPLLQASDNHLQLQILPPDAKPHVGEDDKAYQQYLERAFADPRFRTTLAQIFDKYDGKAAQSDEVIDPSLCVIPTGGGNLVDPAIDAQLESLVHTDNLPYHLDMGQCEPHNNSTDTVDYHPDRLNDNLGVNVPAPASFMPGFPGGVHPAFMQSWYGNAFQGPGSSPSPWDGFSGQIPMPNGAAMAGGPWMATDNFAYNSAPWPPQAMLQIDPALEMAPPRQENPSNEAQIGGAIRKFAQEDESTDNCQPEMELYFDALGRKRRRRPPQPRFSKNGKRLGRPPKSAETLGVSADIGAYDGEGEGEDEDTGPLVDLKPDSEFCDDDDDTLWNELAEALQQASNATQKKRRGRNGTKTAQKGETSATESDGAGEMEKDAGQAETMLRKIQQELIDRAVRRSTMAKEHGEDTDATAEGRRRSGRDRKPANFGKQVSWEKVSAERRTSYKIKMHLRALSVQARRERKKKEKEEAEAAAKEREEAEKAEKVRKEKQEAEEEAAAAAAKAAADEAGEAMPSTIPDSQDSVTSLPIRTTPKKPQSNQIMRQTMKNHVNSVVHFEEDDEGLPDDGAPAAFPIKNSVLAFKKPEVQVHNFLGENYMDTVYALSDDESPALLASLKRSLLGEKKKPSLVRVPVARARETANATKQFCSKVAKQTVTAELTERQVTPITHSDTDTAEAMQAPSCNPTEPDEATAPLIPTGGDCDDSGIDIRSEQASSEQAERPVARTAVPAELPLQDRNLLGAADILDSLDVMSETEDTTSSPTNDYYLADEDMHLSDLVSPSANTDELKTADEPLFVDEEHTPMYGSMEIFKDVAADIPLESEEADMDHNQAVEPTTNVFVQSTVKDRLYGKGPEQEPLMTNHEFTNTVSVRPTPDAFGIEAEEDRWPIPSNGMPILPPSRHPLPQQSNPKRPENRKSISSLNSRTSLPKATSKEPSPSNTREGSRRLSSSSSRTPALDSRDNHVRKSSSSSRRSLLSLIGGGEDDVETFIKRKPSTPAAPKSTHAVASASSSSLSRKTSASSRNGSSRRKSQPPSSLTRLSLGSMSSRDKPRSSKDRQEAKERKRKSTGTASSTTAPAEQQGTCGVDGYTCGRDFCFTCL